MTGRSTRFAGGAGASRNANVGAALAYHEATKHGEAPLALVAPGRESRLSRSARLLATIVAVTLLGAGACSTFCDQCTVARVAMDAALGDSEAKYELAVAFYRGEMVRRDWGKAANLWRQLAETGHVAAHNDLGYLTYHGLGVEQDREEGMRLWRFAAEQGHAGAQLQLAYAYADQRAAKPDLVEALAWAITSLHRAEESPAGGRLGGGPGSVEMAEDLIEKIGRQLTPEQVRRARARAKRYVARYAPQVE